MSKFSQDGFTPPTHAAVMTGRMSANSPNRSGLPKCEHGYWMGCPYEGKNLTLDEAVDATIKHLIWPEEKQDFLNTPRDRLVKHHLTFGMVIRNAFSIWEERNTLRREDEHPDDCSMRIIRAVWDKMHAI